MALVVDASVTLAWCLLDEQSEYAEVIFDRFLEESATVPSVWPLEVANGLLIAERRGRVKTADIARAHGLLSTLPITPEEPSLEAALGPVLALARLEGLSSYDASYLELAMRHGLPLATVDNALRAAAARVGVALAE